MNPDPRAMPFGRYLKAIRTQQGIPLEEVAYETRISLRMLMLIEDEAHEELPPATEVQSLLRTYAKWLGVDEDDIVDRYEINRSFFYQKHHPDDDESLKGGRRFWLRMALALIFVLTVAGGSYYFFQYYRTSSPVKAVDPAEATLSPEIKAETPDVGVPEPAPQPTDKPSDPSAVELPPPAQLEKLFLKIDAVEETMIKIGIDGADLVAYLLNPKDHIELEASSRIHMEVHNPGGVTVTLNDQPVAVNGKEGEIVNLELTHPE